MNLTNNYLQQTPNIWEHITETVKLEFGAITYRNWLGHLKFKSCNDDILHLDAPTKFIGEWIETNYQSALVTLFSRSGLNIKDIVINVNDNLPITLNSDESQRSYKDDSTNIDVTCDIFNFNLDPKLIFKNFVVGSSNRVAYHASLAVAKGDTQNIAANILYIHGNVGQGKTHLLQSMACHIKSIGEKKILYLSAEKFMHLYLKYMRLNNLIGFKEKIKSCDIFLIDDIQFICGKVATQQEFSNLLSALTEANKLVVISSDINPFMLQLDSRSKSRLIGGFVVEIVPSDYDLRLSILESRRKNAAVNIPDAVLEFIAKNITASNRELEGALNKLIAYSNFESSDITLQSAQNLLKVNLESAQTKISLDHIIVSIAKYFNIEVNNITSKSRSAKFILPRQLTAYFAKLLTTKSLYDIGQSLGKRDHASVIYYIKQIDRKLIEDAKLEHQILEIKALILGNN